MNSDLVEKIKSLLPPECVLEKVEFEGPDLVIYVKNAKKIYENEIQIKNLATELKKKVIVRATSEELLNPEDAKKIIEETIPKEAGLTSIKFIPSFHEVWIDCLKPGLAIGKKGINLKTIISKTNWIPKIIRTPTIRSEIESAIRASIYNESEERKKFLSKVSKRIYAQQEKVSWIKSYMLGGFREVGRSCMILQTANERIMIDCGLNSDTTIPEDAYPYLSEMSVPVEKIDAIVVSHAHLDHCGFIPYLFSKGYNGPVYCTPPTRDLIILLCLDFIKVAKKAGKEPLYSEKDVQKMASHIITREYHEVTDITSEVKLTFYNAGHILGSSIVHLHVSNGLHNLIYTGDFKFGGTKLFDSAEVNFLRADTLFMESTYSGREDIMPSRAEADLKLANLIKETLSKGGKVLIPVFSVGRAQEVMLVLDDLSRKGEIDTKVYLDGMVMEATAIHTVYPEYLKKSVKKAILSNKSPFESKIFETVKKDREEICEESCVILAPSGMLTGGPSVEYLKLLAEDEKNTLIFVGYQGVNTLGRKIQRGDKEVAVEEDGKLKSIKIKMRVETCEGYSGHSDRRQLIAFVKNLKSEPQKIFLMHGEGEKSDDLAKYLSKITKSEVIVPMNMDVIRLR
ncbi:MAG: beta-CASP ribonuclease aCPSF1 [Candidatus Aenigmatarchaeota archaeon]